MQQVGSLTFLNNDSDYMHLTCSNKHEYWYFNTFILQRQEDNMKYNIFQKKININFYEIHNTITKKKSKLSKLLQITIRSSCMLMALIYYMCFVL